MGERGDGRVVPLLGKEVRSGSVEIIVLHNVLGGINRRRNARIDWRNHINGFDMFAVPAGKGKLKKMSIRTSSSYIAPATVALKKWSDDHFYESAILLG